MDLSSLVPLEGGWSGQTFLAQGVGERAVVRIYPPGDDRGGRGDRAPEIDAAVLRLVRGLLPVAEVLEVRRADPEADTPGLLITSFVEGVRGDELLPTLGPEDLARVGRTLGGLLADLGGMPTLRPGPFLDADLSIGDWGLDGLPDFVERRLPELGHLTPAEIEALREVAVSAQTLLDRAGRTCLVHSDLNPKNLHLDPETLVVRGLLDWEFAHSGHPATDLGNLLRFDRDPTFVSAVLGAYVERRGGAPDETLAVARAADLWALVDLSATRARSPVAARADRLLRAILRDHDSGVPPPA